MKCYKCGAENQEGMKFCQQCGASLAITETSKLAKKMPEFKIDKKHLKFIGVCVCALVALIIAIGVIATIAKPDLYTYREHDIIYLYNGDNDSTSVVFDSDKHDKIIEGEVSAAKHSSDGSCSLALTDEGVLYFVNKKDVQKLVEDVKSCYISENGEIAYYFDAEATLYKVELGKKKIVKIAEECYTGYSIIMSPDGATVLYNKTSEYTNALHVYQEGKDIVVGKGYRGVATANKGKYIYIRNIENDALYVTSFESEEKEKLASSVDSIIWNCDRSEIIFESESKHYISVKGKEKVKICDTEYLSPVYPLNSTALVKSFANMAFIYEDTDSAETHLGYMNKKYEMDRLVKNIDDYNEIFVFDDDIYYVKADNLFVISKTGKYEAQKLADDILTFGVVAEGKYIYYIDDEDTLWCLKNQEDVKQIDTDIETELFTDGKAVYYFVDYTNYVGTLYKTSDGKNKSRVADDVTYCVANSHSISYFTFSDVGDEYFDYWTSSNGKKFNHIIKEATDIIY